MRLHPVQFFLLKEEWKEARYLTDEEAQHVVGLLMEEPDIRVKTAILTLLYSGIRRGELCGLEWWDIDWERGLLHIRRASQYQRGKGVVTVSPKNKSSVRSVKVAPILMDVLKQYRGWWSEQKLAHSDAWKGTVDRLFIQLDGRPIDPNSIGKWLKRFRDAHNLRNFTPHSCRHTFATLQLAAGVDIRTLQARTGHSQASTLTDIYAHAINSATAAASDALDHVLTPEQYKQA